MIDFFISLFKEIIKYFQNLLILWLEEFNQMQECLTMKIKLLTSMYQENVNTQI